MLPESFAHRHSSKMPKRLSLHPYLSRSSGSPRLAQSGDACPRGFPNVCRLASEEIPPATTLRFLPARYPPPQIALLARYSPRTPVFCEPARTRRPCAAPPPPRAHRAHVPDLRWQFVQRLAATALSSPTSLSRPAHQAASRLQSAQPRTHKPFPAPPSLQLPAFADTRYPPTRTGRRVRHSESAQRNSRSSRRSLQPFCPPLSRIACPAHPAQISNPPPLPHEFLERAQFDRSAVAKEKSET